MGFVKLVKTRAYFKRFQTKLRRRREGKTDYYARKRLIIQDKDKYNSPKYRFVARVTSHKVICQVIYATLIGDKVLCQANSAEFKKLGLTAGTTNYASAYLTGLLCARRLLKQVGLDTMYQGKAAYGEDYSVVEEQKDRRPFMAVLDVGLAHTTTGNRVFGCLKGAVDGGLYIPHSTKRFPGYFKDEDNEKYEAKVHRDRIFGVHIDKYMKILKDSSEEEYQRKFSKWDVCLKKTGCKSVEALFQKLHAEVKKSPEFLKNKVHSQPNRVHAKYRLKKLNRQQKRDRAVEKFKLAKEVYAQDHE